LVQAGLEKSTEGLGSKMGGGTAGKNVQKTVHGIIIHGEKKKHGVKLGKTVQEGLEQKKWMGLKKSRFWYRGLRNVTILVQVGGCRNIFHPSHFWNSPKLIIIFDFDFLKSSIRNSY